MPRWKRWSASCLMVATFGLLMVAPGAEAARTDCPGQYFCVWDTGNYTGRMLQFHDNGWQNLTGWDFNDKASAYFNNTNRYARLSYDINGQGGGECFRPGNYSSMTGWNLNNNASAVWLGTSPAC
jgi:hypothetical protein